MQDVRPDEEKQKGIPDVSSLKTLKKKQIQQCGRFLLLFTSWILISFCVALFVTFKDEPQWIVAHKLHSARTIHEVLKSPATELTFQQRHLN